MEKRKRGKLEMDMQNIESQIENLASSMTA